MSCDAQSEVVVSGLGVSEAQLTRTPATAAVACTRCLPLELSRLKQQIKPSHHVNCAVSVHFQQLTRKQAVS